MVQLWHERTAAAVQRAISRTLRNKSQVLAGTWMQQCGIDLCPIGRMQGQLCPRHRMAVGQRSEEHTSELQSLMRISYAVFCLKKKNKKKPKTQSTIRQNNP